jgi:hypothetical protein
MARWHIDEPSGRHHTWADGRKEQSRREVNVVRTPSNPRRDIEKFLAMGGGSFDALLDMLGEERVPQTLPMETASRTPGSPAWLPQGYRLEYGPDALILRRVDGRFVAAFSPRGATGEAIVRAAEEDSRGWPAYSGPEEHARSARRLVETRANHSWERFLRTERRMLRARRDGQMARALFWRLPGEPRAVLDRIASEDRRRAEEGLVELRSEGGEFSCKHIEELSPEDRMDRIRAELARIVWLLERHERRKFILRSNSFGQRQSRKSVS